MKIHRLLLLGLLLSLLVAAPPDLRAQGDDEEELPPNTGFLTVVVDQQGSAKVGFQLRVNVSDQEPLKRALAESFSFPPLQFNRVMTGPVEDESDELEGEAAEEKGPEIPWTYIAGESPRAFSHNGMKSSFRINLESLIPLLRSHNVEHLRIWVMFQNAPADLTIHGAERRSVLDTHLDMYEAEIDLRAPAVQVIDFTMGYSVSDLLKKTLPLLGFLLLPSLWTLRSARKFADRPEELWGRHLRFMTRLLNLIWIVWLPIFDFSHVDNLISFVCGPEYRELAQLANITLYFVPPILAMMLCHFASRKVYELAPAVEFSPRDVIRHAITVTAFSLTPLFLLILGINTLRSSARQAALYVVIGYVGWLILSHAVSRVFEPNGYPLTSGDLHFRILDLARKAGVLLKGIYVIPENRAQLSNAYARSDDCVMVTNSVLKHLSRREVDAVMAHEIGHLQKRHPHMFTTITLVIVIAANVVGTALTWMMGLQQTALVFSLGLALSSLVVFFVSRRNERQADAIGITLTGDPEAFISGLSKLSRLSLEPMHSGVWGESFDTHPGTMRRFEEIAQSHGISTGRLRELVSAADTPPDDTYPAIETEDVEARVFTSEFKKKYKLRTALVLLAVMLLTPVPFAMQFAANSGLLRLVIAVAGVVCCFGLYQLVRNKIVYWGHARLTHKLKAKLEKRGLSELAQSGAIVGLAPAAESRNYEGYPFWDLGVLWLSDEKLYFVGEQTEFALERGQVENVYAQNANPEWLSEKNVFVEWQKNDQPEKETLHFVAVGRRSLWQARRYIDSLQNRLEDWRNNSGDFPPAPASLASLVPPALTEIASAPAGTSFNVRLFLGAAFQLACYAGVVAFAVRLSFVGMCYMAAVVFLGTFIDEFPKLFVKRSAPVDQPLEPAAYQPGSWADSESAGA